ncbi:MAG: bifunctional diaminohydroxyphosphoribosylaminopyrimidine deaminase/5-amino-6-(5-phosphoribosylamino)uracil reductase RibD [Paludibacteraceae bacterium]|nr:bifunctional diaminohydroxyphosphoribosylaminopyrimidine deaminase/5-amino-6-(5-phosphoribosylamino)uracil reductase RibD [Paludibacteraceae bacterium]
MHTDELYMRRCLQLAHQAAGHTAPNPMVGAVVVYDGRIIGEGYHHRCGEPHAEVNAIASVQNPELLRHATLYVNLEPCSHYGKTPPCAKLIIEKKIPRVVVGMGDPNERVNGRGIAMLREAGVEVVTFVLEDECRQLNRRFVTFHTQHRPYVILKWAQTADGFIDVARTDNHTPPLRISNNITKTLNHQMRTEEAAILVGTNTALLDNPHLTARKWSGQNPVRMVVDRTLRIPTDYHLYDGTTPTVIFTDETAENRTNITFAKLDFGHNIVPQILDYLYQNNLQSVIVEGGRQLLQAFIDAGVWDEAHIETAPMVVGCGVPAPKITMNTTETIMYEQNRMDIGTRITT